MLLNTHSHFSLGYGIVSPKEQLELAQSLGYNCFAVTDINNTSACLELLRLASRKDFKVSVGIDFRNGIEQRYVGIAKNNNGFKELNQHLSKHLHKELPFENEAPYFKDVFVIYPFHNYKGWKLAKNEFIGVSSRQLVQYKRSEAYKSGLLYKTVILETCTFRNQRDFNTHRLLRAISENTLLSLLGKDKQADPKESFISKGELTRAFNEFPEILVNTQLLLNQTQVSFDFANPSRNYNQSAYTSNQELDFRLMKKICWDNLHYRYPNPSDEIVKRLEMELDIIHKKQFVSYFLINWKILKYARNKGYFYVGRGSGANSVVAYLMRITDVDPIELDLYFERFINLYRENPPDFDIDFSWADRDDVTEFIFRRFPNVALQGTYVTFQYRAVVRELGKVFGLPKHEIDRLSDGKFQAGSLDRMGKLVKKYSSYIQGIPHRLSVHSCGILIADRPIHCFGGTFMPPKGFPTIQFDMIVAEDVGLYKFDILSQRGLGKIKDCMELIQEHHPNDEIDIHDMNRFKEDERIKYMLRNADAIGCFYVESPAMRMLMRKLQVDDYLGLVAASSVIRPGVAQSGMMRQYILRYRYPEKRKEAHPVLQEIMPDTYGVMVYQEDVIKVAHYFAGLTLGEADVLRRGMSGKYRGREEFERVRAKFFSNCDEKGYNQEFSKEVWRQIASFAGYAFAKGHSASYAVESYQALFLKAYYPLEYLVATLNNSGGFYSREHYIHEARMKGGKIELPCINQSEALCSIHGDTIYLGIAFVQGIESQTVKDILLERYENGVFVSLTNLVKRVPVSLEQLSLLIRTGTLRSIGEDKKELLWEAHFLLGHVKKSKPVPELFGIQPVNFELPPLYTDQLEDAFDEMELLGFPMSDPFNLIRDDLDLKGLVMAYELPEHNGKEVKVLGYLVTIKNTKTQKGDAMNFGTFVDQNGEYLDTVHFPPIAKKFPFRGKGIYLIQGKVMEEFDCITIEVSQMRKVKVIEDPRYSDNVSSQPLVKPVRPLGRKKLLSQIGA